MRITITGVYRSAGQRPSAYFFIFVGIQTQSLLTTTATRSIHRLELYKYTGTMEASSARAPAARKISIKNYVLKLIKKRFEKIFFYRMGNMSG